GVRHRDRAERVLASYGLVFEAVARPTAPGPLGTAALDDELGNDAVEDQSVVIPLSRQADEVVDRLRRELGVDIHHDATPVGRDGRPMQLAGIELLGRSVSHARAPRRRSCLDYFFVRLRAAVVGDDPSSTAVTCARSTRTCGAYAPLGATIR